MLDSPELLYIELTNKCNLSCKMCFSQSSKRIKGFMSLNLFKSVMDEISNLPISTVVLHFGGESFYHPKFLEFIDYASQYDMNYLIYTNGTIINAEIVKSLSKLHRLALGISLHVNVENVINNIIKYVPRDSDIGVRFNMVSGDVGLETINKYKECKGFVIKPSIKNYSFQNDELFIIKESGISYCKEIMSTMVVLWDGSITLCCRDIGGEMAFGDVAHDGIIGSWTSEVYRNIRLMSLLKNKPQCLLHRKCKLYRQHAFLRN